MSRVDLPCLKINSNYAPLSVISTRKAFEDMFAGAVIPIRFESGYPIRYSLEEWMQLNVDDPSDCVPISGTYSGDIRCVLAPRVVLSINYGKLPIKEARPTSDNVYRRYGGMDAVTRKPLNRIDMSLEHVRPRSKNGSTDWSNLVPMHRQLNSKRGNKSYRKIGLKKPDILPAPPARLPIHSMVNHLGWPEWDFFHVPNPRPT